MKLALLIFALFASAFANVRPIVVQPRPILSKTTTILSQPTAPLSCPVIRFQAQLSKLTESAEMGEMMAHQINFEIKDEIDGAEFVDLHYRLNDGAQVNVRMNKGSDKLWNFSPIMLHVGDKLEYSFTYCVMMNGERYDCDTEWFEFELPAPQAVLEEKSLVCPVLEASHSLIAMGVNANNELEHSLRFESSTEHAEIEFVDLHYKINSGKLINVRMNKLSDKLLEMPLNLKAGDKLEYFFTYCVMINGQQIDCDTEWFESEIAPPQAIEEEAPLECPVISFTHTVSALEASSTSEMKPHKVKFEITDQVDATGFVDLHYKLNQDKLVNVRMNKQSDKLWDFETITMKAGDKLEYFFTYCVLKNGDRYDCDTETFTFNMPAAVKQKKH